MEHNLKELEDKSVYILREAKLKFGNVAALWSMGKDSTTVLELSRKAFMGKVPFPVIHIDNGIDFPETYEFRERVRDLWGLDLIVARSEIRQELSGFSCCGENKTKALQKVMDEYGFRALIVSIRRDEHGVRAKERYFSPRDREFRWDYKNQPPEFWDNYSSSLDEKGHLRVHPILDWNELDIWRYIQQENIPVNPLYFSQNGYRYRSLGCTHCTVPVRSDASNVDQIVSELRTTKTEEREGREQDKEKEYVMQKLRSLGYM
ncbi:MAG: sulfate adenylyltransferase subunit CysD [Thermoprotei archaeon]